MPQRLFLPRLREEALRLPSFTFLPVFTFPSSGKAPAHPRAACFSAGHTVPVRWLVAYIKQYFE